MSVIATINWRGKGGQSKQREEFMHKDNENMCKKQQRDSRGFSRFSGTVVMAKGAKHRMRQDLGKAFLYPLIHST